MEDKTGILRNTEIFAEAGNETLMKIADALIPEKYKKNQLIIRKGEKGQAMYIIVSGKVRVHDGGHVLSRLKEGQTFGEYSLFDEETRSASVTAEVNTELYKLDQKDFFDLIAKDAEITRGILKVLIRQMRDRNVLEEKLSKSYIKIQKQKEEIATQNDNILEQKQLLEQQNYDLVSLNEEKNNLLSVVVHGLRNPLTSSLCLADMLRNEKEHLHESHQEYTDVICKSLRRMNGMINQMLNLNKIDSKKFKLKLEKLNIAKIIRDVIQNFQIIAKQKNIEFKLKVKNLYAKLNQVYLVQIIDNLISNALKFTPENSVIEINLKEKNGKIVLEIIDEGPGVDEKKAEKIFNLYERQTSKINMTESQAGLGLAIVNKYVKAMHGKVWYETEKGKGAKFSVEFNKLIEDPNQE